jgi:ribosome-binding protein aMBF1 (putative translation factor)
MASKTKSAAAMKRIVEELYARYEQMYSEAREDIEQGNYDLSPRLNERHLLIQKEALLQDFLRDLVAITF